MNVLTYPNTILNERSQVVVNFSSDLEHHINDMIVEMNSRCAVGLASPQVGVMKRAIIVKDVSNNDDIVMINPEITSSVKNLVVGDEGCLSIPGVHVKVQRSTLITVRYQGLNGSLKIIDAEGFLARIIQHEIDHLNGVLMINHLNRHDRRKALKGYEPFNLGN